MTAYNIKEIQKMENDDNPKSDYARFSVKIKLRNAGIDFLHFSDAQSRERAVSLIKNHM